MIGALIGLLTPLAALSPRWESCSSERSDAPDPRRPVPRPGQRSARHRSSTAAPLTRVAMPVAPRQILRPATSIQVDMRPRIARALQASSQRAADDPIIVAVRRAANWRHRPTRYALCRRRPRTSPSIHRATRSPASRKLRWRTPLIARPADAHAVGFVHLHRAIGEPGEHARFIGAPIQARAACSDAAANNCAPRPIRHPRHRSAPLPTRRGSQLSFGAPNRAANFHRRFETPYHLVIASSERIAPSPARVNASASVPPAFSSSANRQSNSASNCLWIVAPVARHR